MYKIKWEKKAIKEFKTFDKTTQLFIKKWIDKNIYNTNAPRRCGNPLKGNLSEYWRYRIGNYRIICKIEDNELCILVISIGSRKSIYK